jgi:hypothetical protein
VVEPNNWKRRNFYTEGAEDTEFTERKTPEHVRQGFLRLIGDYLAPTEWRRPRTRIRVA